MAYKTPSHDIFNKPGDEGSCPPETLESAQGKSYPNGDNSHPPIGSVELKSQGDQRNYSGSPSSNPVEAMPGA